MTTAENLATELAPIDNTTEPITSPETKNDIPDDPQVNNNSSEDSASTQTSTILDTNQSESNHNTTNDINARNRTNTTDPLLNNYSDEYFGIDLSTQITKMPKEAQPGKYEFIFYLIFTIIFTFIAILSRGESDFGYSQTQSLRVPLIKKSQYNPWNGVGENTFEDISTVDDIYGYINEVVFPFLFGDENGDIKTFDNFYITPQSILLGGLRLKQVRYQPLNKCPQNMFTNCYDLSEEDTQSNYKGYKYMTDDQLLDQSYRGKYGNYPGGGYVQDFTKQGGSEPLSTLLNAKSILQNLKNMEWIDGGTRFITLDFNAYNPTSSLHTCVRIMWETQGGNVHSNEEFKSWKFLRYDGSQGIILLTLHIIFFIMLVGFTLMEIRSCYKLGCCCSWCGLFPRKNNKCQSIKGIGCTNIGYWGSTMWHFIDVVNYTIFYLWIMYYIRNEIHIKKRKNELLDLQNYYSLRDIQYQFTFENYTAGMNGFLLYFKLFKFLTVNRRMGFFFALFKNASTDLIIFLIILCVFFLSFGTLGYMLFSSDVDAYRSFPTSLRNMIRFAVTPMNYDALTESSLLSGGLFYFIWSLLMLLILANVFIAILAQAYTEIVEDFADDDEDTDPFSFLKVAKTGLTNLFGAMKGKTAEELFAHIDANPDGKITGKELAKAAGINEKIAHQLIQKYDKNGDGELDMEEFKKLAGEINKDIEAMKDDKNDNNSDNNNDNGKDTTNNDTNKGEDDTKNGDDQPAPTIIKQKSANAGLLGIPRESKPRSSKKGLSQESFAAFIKLQSQIQDINELLQDVLQMTSAGKKVLKKRKKKGINSTVNSTVNSPMSSDDNIALENTQSVHGRRESRIKILSQDPNIQKTISDK